MTVSLFKREYKTYNAKEKASHECSSIIDTIINTILKEKSSTKYQNSTTTYEGI